MKKIILSSLVMLPVLANVEMPTIYGKINKAAVYTQNDDVHTDRTSFDGFTDVHSSESRLGAKGKFDVKKLKGSYKLELGLNSTKADANDEDRIRIRQAVIGFDTSFGKIKAGQTYTPIDALVSKNDVLGSTIASFKGDDVKVRIENGGTASKGLGFKYRSRNDLVSYATPDFGGFSLALSIDQSESQTNDVSDAAFSNTHYQALANFKRKLGNVDTNIYAGYDVTSGDRDNKEEFYYLYGANLGFGKFSLNIGAGQEERTNNADVVDLDVTRLFTGVSYDFNKSNKLSLTYQTQEEDVSKQEYTQIAAGYKYKAHKNIDLTLTYLMYNFTQGTTDEDSSMAAAGVQLKF